MPYRHPSPIVVALVAATLLAACTSSDAGPKNTLTIKGAGGAPPPVPPLALITTGDPSALDLSMYALYISPNADCSAAVLVQDYGTTAVVKDMLASPTLFSGTAAPGSYKCVAFKMSDVIHAMSASSFGACVTGVDYVGDIYRNGETDWKDINLNPIIGSGDDTLPVDDRVTIIITADTLAALARGFSTHQLIPMTNDLVVPGTSTFYWDATGSLVDNGTACDINSGVVSFR